VDDEGEVGLVEAHAEAEVATTTFTAVGQQGFFDAHPLGLVALAAVGHGIDALLLQPRRHPLAVGDVRQ